MKSQNITPTEMQNPRTRNLDGVPAGALIAMINREDSLAATAVKKASKQIEAAVRETAARFMKGGKIIFIGAGTSGRLGIIEAAECPPTFSTDPKQIIAIMAGGKSSVFKAKEGAEDDIKAGQKDILKVIKKGDIVFGIAASGRTPYVLAALKAAKKKGAYTNLITCNNGVSHGAADNIIYLPTGPEALQGSTRMKAGTATKMALNTITTAAMVLCGKVYKNHMVDVKANNNKLRARALGLVCTITGLSEAKAQKTLETANYKVKDAVIMLKLGLDKTQAAALLKKNGGRLGEILCTKKSLK